MIAAGMRSCAIAVHFCPCGFALPLLCCFAFGLPHPTCLLVHGGPLCLGKYTYSLLRILRSQCDRCQGEVTMGFCHGYPPPPPLFAFCPHLLIACFAVNWHLLSNLNIAYQQVNQLLNTGAWVEKSYCESSKLSCPGSCHLGNGIEEYNVKSPALRCRV